MPSRAAYMNPVRDLRPAIGKSDDYVDFAFRQLPRYPTSNPIINNYAGISNRQLGYCSMEFAQGDPLVEERATVTTPPGYGCHLVFAMSLESNTFPATNNDRFQVSATQPKYSMAKSIVWDGNTYGKDW